MMKAVLITLALLLLPWCLRADSDTLRPVADGTYEQSSVVGTTDHYDAVDDVSADDGSTFINEGNVDDTTTVKMDVVTIGSTHEIDSLVAFFRTIDGGIAKDNRATPFLIRDGNEGAGTEFAHPFGYGNTTQALDRPGGGSWGYADFADTLQLGLIETTVSGGSSKYTQWYLVVYHADTTSASGQIIMVK
jgi:hypothetical protein